MYFAMRLMLAAGAWIAVSVASAADLVPPAAKKLDAYFDALAAHQLANGSIAISQRGVLRYQRSVGFSKLIDGRPEPADDSTRYRIGPVSQLYTAAMIMQLAEGASITLDSRLAEFYPDLPNALDITYRDLLQHRSGLANYTAADHENWRTSPRTQAELLGIIGAAGAGFAPRQRVEYNPTNYLLLGYVLEKIQERPYPEILQRRIAARLGLSRTYYIGSGLAASLESVSYASAADGWRALAPTDPSMLGGAGGIVSTPAELVRFIDALFTGKIVTAHSLASMRSQEVGPGLGLWSHDFAGQTGYGQSGGIDAYRACVYHFPDSGISIAYATNAVVLPMEEIVAEVLALIFERGRRPPTFEPGKSPR